MATHEPNLTSRPVDTAGSDELFDAEELQSDALGFFEDWEWATTEAKVCPSRLWAIGGKNFRRLLPSRWRLEEQHARALEIEKAPQNGIDGDENQYRLELEDHERCNFEFCEYSLRDFTGVEQRHECLAKDCPLLKGLFSRDILRSAAESNSSTVWALDGLSMLERHRPYMAISHVWSDGTGAGAWPDGEVNECLYSYFKRIAEQFQCEGIWWDTICIPKEKAAREKAIRKIQSNYENARITLVHDVFLRNWIWDSDTACFAIIMSTWFSRGWTALELSKSRKVKVIFREKYGAVVKDLDEEILARDSDTYSHKEASRIVRNLRQGITSLNELLRVLQPRHTSWPKDRAIISALLMNVGIPKGALQLDVYKSILREGRPQISHGNLFHNSATASEGSWCPTNLLDLPQVPRSEAIASNSLFVQHDLSLWGRWYRLPASSVPLCEYNWRGVHPFMKEKLQLHLVQAFAKHPRYATETTSFLLFEPSELSDKALLVKPSHLVTEPGFPPYYEYLGAVFFTKSQKPRGNLVEVLLLGETIHTPTINKVLENRPPAIEQAAQRMALHEMIWQGNYDRFGKLLLEDVELYLQDELGQMPLHLAAERGNVKMVQDLLMEAKKDDVIKDVLNARCVRGHAPLHRAAWGGSLQVVLELLRYGADVNIPDTRGDTALHLATAKGFDHAVMQLVDFGCDCTAKNKQGVTPLHFAAWTGQEEVAEWLLSKDANLAALDKHGWAPMHYAVANGQLDMIKLLHRRGASVNGTISESGSTGWTPLHFAAMNGQHHVIRFLQELGARQSMDKYGWTPSQLARCKGYSKVMNLLSKTSEHVNESMTGVAGIPPRHWSPLHCLAIQEQHVLIKALLEEEVYDLGESWSALPSAAKRGQRVVVQLLLDDENVDKNEREKCIREALKCAAENGHLAVVELLLGAGIRTNLEDEETETALSLAAKNGHGLIVQGLLQRGAKGETLLRRVAQDGHEDIAKGLLNANTINVNCMDTDSRTPLSFAAENGHGSIVQQLLDMTELDVDTKDIERRTPLSYASEKGRRFVVRQLLATGKVDKDSRGRSGVTPLFYAVQSGHANIVKQLLSAGANPSAGRPLYLAASCGHEGIVKQLLDAGADVSRHDAHGGTALTAAAEKGHRRTVKSLLKGKVNVVETSKHVDSATPLLYAARNGHNGVVSLLLRARATVDASNAHGQTPLSQAVFCGHDRVVRQLLQAKAAFDLAREKDREVLFHAIGGRHEEIVKMLLDTISDVNVRNSYGETLLSWAALNGYEDVVKRLLAAGAEINTVDENGRSPMWYAEQYGNDRIVELLQGAPASL